MLIRAPSPRDSVSPDVRAWWATSRDAPWVLALLKRYRDQEFFFVPDSAVPREIAAGNILCCDYRGLEAGYIWGTFARGGRSRINQVAISEELWRQGVGSLAVESWEARAQRRGAWAVYLSCNSRTPGHRFWPTLGYTAVLTRAAGRRGGDNLIWAKLVDSAQLTLGSPPGLDAVKRSYRFQASIEAAKRHRRMSSGQVSMTLTAEQGNEPCAMKAPFRVGTTADAAANGASSPSGMTT